jgi:glycerol uptake facilitator-like aquaporin
MLLDKIKIEFLGTFLYVFFIGQLLVQRQLKQIQIIEFSLGCFFIYNLLLWFGKSFSNAQYNPVITLSMIFTKHNKLKNGIVFIIIQLLAAFFAVSIIRTTMNDDSKTFYEDSILGFPI